MTKHAWLPFCVVLFCALPARGDDPKSVAESKFKEGVVLAKQGDWKRARPLFEQSLAIHPTASGLLNLALAEEATGSPLEALAHARAFLVHPKADPKAVEETRATVLPRLWGAVGHLRIRGASAVTLDGSSLPPDKLAEEIDVRVGKHVVDDGRRRVEVDVPAGVVTDVELSGSAAAGRRGEAAARPRASGASTATIVGVGLGAGALAAGGLGILFASQASGESDAADAALARDPSAQRGCLGSAAPACREALDAAESERSFRNASTGLFIGAGALALGAVATFAFWPSSSSPSGAGPTSTRGAVSRASSEPRVSGVGVIPALGGGAVSVLGQF